MTTVSQSSQLLMGGSPTNITTEKINTNPTTNCNRLTFPDTRTPMMILVMSAKSHSDTVIMKPKRTPARASGIQERSGLSSSSRRSSPIFRVNPARRYAEKYTTHSIIHIHRPETNNDCYSGPSA